MTRPTRGGTAGSATRTSWASSRRRRCRSSSPGPCAPSSAWRAGSAGRSWWRTSCSGPATSRWRCGCCSTGTSPRRCSSLRFPTPLRDAVATFDIPYGTIERATDGEEEPGQRWVDVSADGAGLAVLNRLEVRVSTCSAARSASPPCDPRSTPTTSRASPRPAFATSSWTWASSGSASPCSPIAAAGRTPACSAAPRCTTSGRARCSSRITTGRCRCGRRMRASSPSTSCSGP